MNVVFRGQTSGEEEICLNQYLSMELFQNAMNQYEMLIQEKKRSGSHGGSSNF